MSSLFVWKSWCFSSQPNDLNIDSLVCVNHHKSTQNEPTGLCISSFKWIANQQVNKQEQQKKQIFLNIGNKITEIVGGLV